MSRFENGFDKHSVFALCNAWVDRYVLTLAGREQLVIDIDGTDDPTHGEQQLSMFNGYYGQFMYNELFFHDGDTGQNIVRLLRRRPVSYCSNRTPPSIPERYETN
jgi:hypothetical protein